MRGPALHLWGVQGLFLGSVLSERDAYYSGSGP